MNIKHRTATKIPTKLLICLIPLCAIHQSNAAQSANSVSMNFQAPPAQCINGFQKTTNNKNPNGMVSKMVCKTPVFSCPENTTPGITTLTEPVIKNMGGADNKQSFRFIYTCSYYKVEG